MDSFPITFTASIETKEFTSYQHPWHFGTIESIARECVEHVYKSRVKFDLPVLTIALKFDGKIVDVFDGTGWVNASLDKAASEAEKEWA